MGREAGRETRQGQGRALQLGTRPRGRALDIFSLRRGLCDTPGRCYRCALRSCGTGSSFWAGTLRRKLPRQGRQNCLEERQQPRGAECDSQGAPAALPCVGVGGGGAGGTTQLSGLKAQAARRQPFACAVSLLELLRANPQNLVVSASPPRERSCRRVVPPQREEPQGAAAQGSGTPPVLAGITPQLPHPKSLSGRRQRSAGSAGRLRLATRPVRTESAAVLGLASPPPRGQPDTSDLPRLWAGHAPAQRASPEGRTPHNRALLGKQVPTALLDKSHLQRQAPLREQLVNLLRLVPP